MSAGIKARATSGFTNRLVGRGVDQKALRVAYIGDIGAIPLNRITKRKRLGEARTVF